MSREYTTKGILEDALELIEDPDRWTRGFYARDAEGVSVDPYSERACRFCALGAVARISGRDIVPIAPWARLDEAARAAGFPGARTLNDTGTHDDVVTAFRRAIANCEEVRKQ